MEIEEINNRIQNEICLNTLNELSDENLICEYKECKSVKNEIKKLENILDKYLEKEIKEKIIQGYLYELIPPGTKGVIRGNKFNKIVRDYINNLIY